MRFFVVLSAAVLCTVSSQTLDIHLLPHAHMDLGWLHTVDEYFVESVDIIISSVVESLSLHPDRTFTIAESGFLAMWWRNADDVLKEAVRKERRFKRRLLEAALFYGLTAVE